MTEPTRLFKDRRAEKRALFAFRYGARPTKLLHDRGFLAALVRRPPWWLRWQPFSLRRCGWCRRTLGLKWFGWGRGGDVTHGICRPCKADYDKELDRMEAIGRQFAGPGAGAA